MIKPKAQILKMNFENLAWKRKKDKHGIRNLREEKRDLNREWTKNAIKEQTYKLQTLISLQQLNLNMKIVDQSGMRHELESRQE